MHRLFSGKQTVRARALLVGEHLDLRALETTDRLATPALRFAYCERKTAGAKLLASRGSNPIF